MTNLKMILFITISLFANLVFSAQPNPQIRICNQFEGTFITAQLGTDQVGLCQINQSIIGSLDLLYFKSEEQKNITQSIQTYMDGIQACEPYGSTTVVEVIQGGPSIEVCLFNDRSMIESNTLKKGSSNLENANLNKILGL